MLICAGKLIEKGGLAAVLVSHQGKGQFCSLRQRVTAALGMVFAAFTQSGVLRSGGNGRGLICRLCSSAFRHFDPVGVLQTQGQLISVEHQFHGITHGCIFNHLDFSSGNHAHIQKMLTKSAFAANFCDDGAAADGQIFESHEGSSLL